MSKAKCCFIDPEHQGKEEAPWCELPCNWEIRDTTNQDPHTNDTYACDKHLADLLNESNHVTYIGVKGE